MCCRGGGCTYISVSRQAIKAETPVSMRTYLPNQKPVPKSRSGSPSTIITAKSLTSAAIVKLSFARSPCLFDPLLSHLRPADEWVSRISAQLDSILSSTSELRGAKRGTYWTYFLDALTKTSCPLIVIPASPLARESLRNHTSKYQLSPTIMNEIFIEESSTISIYAIVFQSAHSEMKLEARHSRRCDTIGLSLC